MYNAVAASLVDSFTRNLDSRYFVPTPIYVCKDLYITCCSLLWLFILTACSSFNDFRYCTNNTVGPINSLRRQIVQSPTIVVQSNWVYCSLLRNLIDKNS